MLSDTIKRLQGREKEPELVTSLDDRLFEGRERRPPHPRQTGEERSPLRVIAN